MNASPGAVTLPVPLGQWLAGSRRLRLTIGEVDVLQYGEGDGEDLFSIRNHPSVRTFMPDNSPLDLDRHLEWAKANLMGGKTLLMIARRHTLPIGFLMLREAAGSGELELGVMFIASSQKSILPALAAAYGGCLAVDFFGTDFLITHARPEHMLALRLNTGMGLQPAPSSKAGELCFRTSRESLLNGAIVPRYMSAYRRSLHIVE